MRLRLLLLLVLAAACTRPAAAPVPLPEGACLQDGKTAVVIGQDGALKSLRTLATGTDYAGGAGLWRLYYNTKERK